MASAAILETLPIIERRTLGDAAYLHLRELLMSGRVGPGRAAVAAQSGRPLWAFP